MGYIPHIKRGAEKMKNRQDNTEFEWIEYKPKVMEYLIGLELSDFVTPSYESPEDVQTSALLVVRHSLVSKKAFRDLSGMVNSKQLEKIKVRYRSFKYRQSNSMTSLVVSESTKRRVNDLKAAMGALSVDELMDYALSVALEHGEHDFADAEDVIYEDKHDTLPPLLKRLSGRDRATVFNAIGDAFQAGWTKAKSSRSKKKDAKHIASSTYMKQFKI